MRFLLFLVCSLLFSATIAAQTPQIGVLPASVYATTFKPIKRNALDMSAMINHGARTGPDIPAFSNPLKRKIDEKLPKWLRALGVKGFATLKMDDLTEQEQEQFKNFVTTYAPSQGHAIAPILGKSFKKQMSTMLKGTTNELADKVDRDYLLLVDVHGGHVVTNKKVTLPTNPNELAGGVTIVVSIMDAATGLKVASKSKSIGNPMDGQSKKKTKVKEEDILNSIEKLLEQVYKKFVKKMSN